MIVRKIELECEECGEKFTEGMSNEPAWSVRKIAKLRGWKYDRFNGDLCPECLKDIKDLERSK
jgi:ribosomal protein L33